ncbi:conserved protein of unknown function [Rhodovastum atsumiense]|uniref:Uncharacterized protein n=1 Tax=Rhodovastum atsumiense TaxID=504468 RepID=A0A5M6J0E7_9PROT|nr:hypothetical protein [Rhodovastum atsumiense]KAA5614076.1 hypothetical protein F1189_02405 [Rhodovastum atsumiense]CAH2598895.1 conserved protein of unknown function [Rhodovastum atsumiense]
MVDIPADSSADIPPQQTLLYQSPDLVVQLAYTGPNGATYLAAPASQELRFIDYDEATLVAPPVAANVTETPVDTGDPLGYGAQFVVGSDTATFSLGSTTQAIPPATLQVSVAPGGPPVAVTELGAAGGLSVGFDDPAVGGGFVSYGIPLVIG